MNARAQQAYSLYEMMIAITLTFVAISTAIPALSTLQENNRQAAVRDSLHASLNNARTQAIVQNRSVDLCPTTDGTHCQDQWNKGWITRFATRDHTTIAVTQTLQNTQLHWSGFGKNIRFYANGTSPTANGRFFSATKMQFHGS